MKKMISIAVIVMMVCALMVPVVASAAAVTPGQTMWVNCKNGGALHLRKAASTDSRCIANLPCGTKVSILEDSGNGWAFISAGNRTGYVMTKFLVNHKPGKYEITEKSEGFTSVTPYMATAISVKGHDRSVGLRPIPNKDSRSIRMLGVGDEVEVIAQGRLWSKVIDQVTGKTGYVATSYLQRI